MFLMPAQQASQEKVKVLNEHQKLFMGALIHSNSGQHLTAPGSQTIRVSKSPLVSQGKASVDSKIFI